MKTLYRFFLSLFVISTIVLLCSCRPNGMSKEVYSLGKQAVDLMEKYHNGKISSEDVDGPLNSIIVRLEAIEKKTKGERTNKYEYGMQNSDYASHIAYWIESFLYEKNSSLGKNETYERMQHVIDLLN